MRKLKVLSLLGLFVVSSNFAATKNNYSQAKTTLHQTKLLQTQVTTQGVNAPMMSQTSFSALPLSRQKIIAGIFNLTVDEYQRYLHSMNDTSDGYEYQHNTNPNLILAIHTKDKAKYLQYIKNAVHEDHDAIAHMLKVSNDYTRIAKEIYPDELPIMTPYMRAHPEKGLHAGDVAQLYCAINDPRCGNLLGIVLPQIMKTNDARLDIFAVGFINKNNIVLFAKRNGISAQVVSSRKVTLNFGNHAFHALEHQVHKKLLLPFLLVRRHGIEMPVNLGEGS